VHLEDQEKQVNMEISDVGKRNGFVRCSQCQKPLNPGAKFCPNCGSPTSIILNARPDVREAQQSPTSNSSLPVDSKEHIEQNKEAESQQGKPLIDEGIQTSTRYCPYCGAILSKAVSFCGKCGRFLDQKNAIEDETHQNLPDGKSKAAETVPGESALAVLPPATLRSGFLGLKAEGLVLVLTQSRMLFAQQTDAMLKERAQRAKIAAKQEGKGFFGQMGALIESNNGQQYLQMRPDEIINETSGNFSIPNQQVRSIRLKGIADGEGGSSGVRMILRTNKSKLEYTFKNAGKKQIKKLLQQTLGNIVR
jgi:hypothetical protein